MLMIPQCMSYRYDKNGDVIERNPIEVKGLAYVAEGYMIPCCWCDGRKYRGEFEERGFFNEDLLVSNNDSIDDIIATDTWGEFVNDILHNYDKAPKVCQEKCSHE